MTHFRSLTSFISSKKKWVFGIGLSKTATTSLNDALEILGYRPIHLPPINRFDGHGQAQLAWPWWMNKFDAATDLSVAIMHQKLKKAFPNAKFIYTTRNIDAWLDSCRRHFTEELAAKRVEQKNFWVLELSKYFYGHLTYDEQSFKEAYERHDAEVRDSFNSEDLMIWDFTKEPTWDGICRFLDKPLPSVDFPKSNVGRRIIF